MQRRLKHSMPGLWGRKETLMEVEENPQAMIDCRWVDAVDGYYLCWLCQIWRVWDHSTCWFISFGSFIEISVATNQCAGAWQFGCCQRKRASGKKK